MNLNWRPASLQTVRLVHNGKPVSNREAARRNAATERLKPFRFTPGMSGNPGGRPKTDVASEIAQAIFLDNPELIYEAFLKVLKKGSPYGFQVLADRSFGRLREVHQIEHGPYRDLSDEDLGKHIAELKAKLGVMDIPKGAASEPKILPPADETKPN